MNKYVVELTIYDTTPADRDAVVYKGSTSRENLDSIKRYLQSIIDELNAISNIYEVTNGQ